MIRLSGLELGRDIEIEITGIRPGEKLFEELFIKGEEYRRTAHDKIVIACNASSFVPDQLDQLVDQLEAAARHDDVTAISAIFHRLVAEYQPLDKPLPEPKLPPTTTAPATAPAPAPATAPKLVPPLVTAAVRVPVEGSK
jgi:hypothetical protein